MFMLCRGGGLKDVYNPDFVGRVVYKIFWD